MESFILKVPVLNADNYFTYDVIMFLLLWLSLAAGILLCFWGYKYAQTLILLVLGCLCGIIGIRIGETMTSNTILKMCFFIMFTFFGVCMLYLVSILLSVLLVRLRLRDRLFQMLHIITAVLGAILIGALIYLQIFQNVWAAGAICVVMAVSGSMYGKKKAAERKPFYTYDDLYRMEPLEEDKEDA